MTGRPHARLGAGLALALAVAGLAPAAAEAGAFSISPTRVELAPSGAPGTLIVTNRGSAASVVQVEAFRWRDSPSEGLDPTRELLAVPPLFEIGPGGRQLVRLALRAPLAGGEEQAYRLVIGEVPEAVPERHGGVSFALRFNIPVFATPQGAAPRPAWSARRGPGGVVLRLDNDGLAHLQLTRLVVRSGEGGPVLQTVEATSYVLAGRSGSWALPAPGGASSLKIEAETNVGSIEAILPIEGG